VTPVLAKQQWHPYRFLVQLFPLRFLNASTYSNFAPDKISVFEVGARINRRYYSCNWQFRGNFYSIWNSFLRLYHDYLSLLIIEDISFSALMGYPTSWLDAIIGNIIISWCTKKRYRTCQMSHVHELISRFSKASSVSHNTQKMILQL